MRYPSFFQEQLTSLRTYWNGHFLGVSLSPDRIQSSKSRLRQFFGGHQPPHSRWIFGISPPVPAKSGAGQNRAFRSQVEAEWWRLVVSLSLFSWVLSICPAETNGILVGYFLWTEFGFLHLVTRISTCNIVYHEDCHDWSCVSFTFVSELQNLFEFGAYDIEYELDTGVLGWCLIIYLLFWKSDVLFFDYFWIPDVTWNHGYFSSFRIWTFLSMLNWTSVQCSEMGCHVERGCESWSPYGWPVRVTYSWRHVILHRERPSRVRFGTVLCTEDW